MEISNLESLNDLEKKLVMAVDNNDFKQVSAYLNSSAHLSKVDDTKNLAVRSGAVLELATEFSDRYYDMLVATKPKGFLNHAVPDAKKVNRQHTKASFLKYALIKGNAQIFKALFDYFGTLEQGDTNARDLRFYGNSIWGGSLSDIRARNYPLRVMLSRQQSLDDRNVNYREALLDIDNFLVYAFFNPELNVDDQLYNCLLSYGVPDKVRVLTREYYRERLYDRYRSLTSDGANIAKPKSSKTTELSLLDFIEAYSNHKNAKLLLPYARLIDLLKNQLPHTESEKKQYTSQLDKLDMDFVNTFFGGLFDKLRNYQENVENAVLPIYFSMLQAENLRYFIFHTAAMLKHKKSSASNKLDEYLGIKTQVASDAGRAQLEAFIKKVVKPVLTLPPGEQGKALFYSLDERSAFIDKLRIIIAPEMDEYLSGDSSDMSAALAPSVSNEEIKQLFEHYYASGINSGQVQLLLNSEKTLCEDDKSIMIEIARFMGKSLHGQAAIIPFYCKETAEHQVLFLKFAEGERNLLYVAWLSATGLTVFNSIEQFVGALFPERAVKQTLTLSPLTQPTIFQSLAYLFSATTNLLYFNTLIDSNFSLKSAVHELATLSQQLKTNAALTAPISESTVFEVNMLQLIKNTFYDEISQGTTMVLNPEKQDVSFYKLKSEAFRQEVNKLLSSTTKQHIIVPVTLSNNENNWAVLCFAKQPDGKFTLRYVDPFNQLNITHLTKILSAIEIIEDTGQRLATPEGDQAAQVSGILYLLKQVVHDKQIESSIVDDDLRLAQLVESEFKRASVLAQSTAIVEYREPPTAGNAAAFFQNNSVDSSSLPSTNTKHSYSASVADASVDVDVDSSVNNKELKRLKKLINDQEKVDEEQAELLEGLKDQLEFNKKQISKSKASSSLNKNKLTELENQLKLLNNRLGPVLSRLSELEEQSQEQHFILDDPSSGLFHHSLHHLMRSFLLRCQLKSIDVQFKPGKLKGVLDFFANSNTIANVVVSGVYGLRHLKVQGKRKQIVCSVDSDRAIQVAAEKIARQVSLRYASQIAKISKPAAEKLAACASKRMIAFMLSGVDTAKPFVEQVVDSLLHFKFHTKAEALGKGTHTFIEKVGDVKWTDKGIFQKVAIFDKNKDEFYGSQLTDHKAFGACIVDDVQSILLDKLTKIQEINKDQLPIPLRMRDHSVNYNQEEQGASTSLSMFF